MDDTPARRAYIAWVGSGLAQSPEAWWQAFEAGFRSGAPGTPRACKWTADGEIWQTECGHAFEFTADGPTENKAKFCQYCGGNLIEVQLQEDYKP